MTGVQSDSSGVNLGAILPFPVPAVPAEPSPVFLQLMLLLGSEPDPEAASQPEEEIAYVPVEAADPGQIAEAMIRSMLGHGTSQPEKEPKPKAEGETHKCAEPKASQRSEKIPKTRHPQTLTAMLPMAPASPIELPLQPQIAGDSQGAESHAPRGVDLSSPMHAQEGSSPTAPVAFALRLTPREHAAPPREPSTFASGDCLTIQNFSFDTESRGFDGDQPTENHERPHLTKVVIPESQPEPLIEFEAMAPVALQTMASMGGDRSTPSPPEFQAEIPATRQADLEPVQNATLMKPVTAREIAVRVSAPGESNVDVHVAERGGEVRVAVRTADSSLQVSLQQDLGSLIGRLESAGFHAENLATREAMQVAKRDLSEHTPLHSAIPALESTEGFRSHDDSRSPSHEERGSHFDDLGRGQHHRQQQQRQGSGRQAQWRRILEENE